MKMLKPFLPSGSAYGEFAVYPEAGRDRGLANFKRVTDRSAESYDAAFERAKACADAAIWRQLLIVVADQADCEFLGQVFGCGPFEVELVAGPVVRGGVGLIEREPLRRRKDPNRGLDRAR